MHTKTCYNVGGGLFIYFGLMCVFMYLPSAAGRQGSRHAKVLPKAGLGPVHVVALLLLCCHVCFVVNFFQFIHHDIIPSVCPSFTNVFPLTARTNPKRHHHHSQYSTRQRTMTPCFDFSAGTRRTFFCFMFYLTIFFLILNTCSNGKEMTSALVFGWPRLFCLLK